MNMKKRMSVVTVIILVMAMLFSAKAFADGNYSDIAVALEAEEGYSVKSEQGKKNVTAGIQYTIENGSLVLQQYYGRGATVIAIPRSIGADSNGPLYMNYIAQGALVGTGLKAVYLPDCIMLSAKELLAVNPETGEGIYIDPTTEVYTYSGDAKKLTDSAERAKCKNLRENADDPVIPVTPIEEETKQPTAGKEGDFEYANYGPYVEITAYTGQSLNVTVPSHLAGLPVKEIRSSVFSTRKYDLVQIPAGVSSGMINSKKVILNYDTNNPTVIEEKTYETDAEGNTVSIEEIIEINNEDLTTLAEAEPTESGEVASENESASG